MKTHERITMGLISGFMIGIVASTPIMLKSGSDSSPNYTSSRDEMSTQEREQLFKKIAALNELSHKLELEELAQIKKLEEALDRADHVEREAIEAELAKILKHRYSDEFERQMASKQS